MRILITGAQGFLGSHLIDQALSRGHKPLALVRRPAGELSARGVEVLSGDLREGVALPRGLDAIIHAGAQTLAPSEAEFFASNARATAEIARAAVRAGARRFVYVSSLAAHGPSDGGEPRPEESEARPRSAYGRSKRAGEEEALALRDRLEVAVVRPPIVYGPRSPRFLQLFKLARLGVFPLPGDGGGVVSAIDAEDCAAALLAVAESGPPSGAIFAVDDGGRYTMRGLAEAVAREVGRRPVALGLPLFALKAAAKIGDAYARATGKSFFFNSDKLAEVEGRNWVAGNRAISAATGWAPRLTLEDGVRRMHAWYRDRGLL